MSEVIIELQEVRRHFDAGAVRALDGISLQIDRAETLAILGPSGSGKTTMLNLIGALDFPSSGEVRVLGRTRRAREDQDAFRNRIIGFVFQQHHLVPTLTLMENVMLPLYPRTLTRAERKQRAEAVLFRVGLENRTHFFPPETSGGERQRAALARALVTDPQILLADEPTGSLDSASSCEMLDLMLELCWAHATTLIMVTHNRELAGRLGRIVEIKDGKLLMPVQHSVPQMQKSVKGPY